MFLFPENKLKKMHIVSKKMQLQLFLLGEDYNQGYYGNESSDANPYNRIDSMIHDGNSPSTIQGALTEFNYECRKFLGFGYLLSFIPSTNAFEARQLLNRDIKIDLSILQEKIRNIPNVSSGRILIFQKFRDYAALQGPIVRFILLGPLWEILDKSVKKIKTSIILNNSASSFAKIFFSFPLIVDIFHKNGNLRAHPVSHLIHTFLNPMRAINQGLTFAHHITNKLFEIGESHDVPSSKLSIVLKGIAGTCFFVVALVTNLLESVLDIPFLILKNLVAKPLKFIGLSFLQTCQKPQLNQNNYLDSNIKISIPNMNSAHKSLYKITGDNSEVKNTSENHIQQSQPSQTSTNGASPNIVVEPEHKSTTSAERRLFDRRPLIAEDVIISSANKSNQPTI